MSKAVPSIHTSWLLLKTRRTLAPSTNSACTALQLRVEGWLDGGSKIVIIACWKNSWKCHPRLVRLAIFVIYCSITFWIDYGVGLFRIHFGDAESLRLCQDRVWVRQVVSVNNIYKIRALKSVGRRNTLRLVEWRFPSRGPIWIRDFLVFNVNLDGWLCERLQHPRWPSHHLPITTGDSCAYSLIPYDKRCSMFKLKGKVQWGRWSPASCLHFVADVVQLSLNFQIVNEY